jgi:hypothetical protein
MACRCRDSIVFGHCYNCHVLRRIPVLIPLTYMTDYCGISHNWLVGYIESKAVV